MTLFDKVLKGDAAFAQLGRLNFELARIKCTRRNQLLLSLLTHKYLSASIFHQSDCYKVSEHRVLTKYGKIVQILKE